MSNKKVHYVTPELLCDGVGVQDYLGRTAMRALLSGHSITFAPSRESPEAEFTAPISSGIDVKTSGVNSINEVLRHDVVKLIKDQIERFAMHNDLDVPW